MAKVLGSKGGAVLYSTALAATLIEMAVIVVKPSVKPVGNCLAHDDILITVAVLVYAEVNLDDSI